MMYKSSALKLWNPQTGHMGFRVNVTTEGCTHLTTIDENPLIVPNPIEVGNLSFLDVDLNIKLEDAYTTVQDMSHLLKSEDLKMDPDLVDSISFTKEFYSMSSKVDELSLKLNEIGQKDLELLRNDVSFIKRKLAAIFPGSRLDSV